MRPKPRKRDLSARETMTSGPIQYSLLRMTTFCPCSLPRTGLIALVASAGVCVAAIGAVVAAQSLMRVFGIE